MHEASFLQIMKAPSGNLLFTRKDPILLIIIGKQKTLLSTELKVRSFRAKYKGSCLRCPIKQQGRRNTLAMRDHGSAVGDSRIF